MDRATPDEIAALRRSEQRFRAAFQQQFQFMALLDADGRVLEFNVQLDAEGRVLAREEVVGQLFWQTAWWRHMPGMQAAWPERLRQAAAATQALLFEDEFTSSEGELRQASAAVSAVRTPEGGIDCYIVQATDTTERRRGEAIQRRIELQRHETQRLEALGTLAGGIAHDFNNLVAAILGNVALASDQLAAGHPSHEALGRIGQAASRARRLVQQILAFSRGQPVEQHVQQLRPVVEETLALLRSTLPPSVELRTAFALEPLWVRADSTQLQQVLLNLCTNAWHALPGGKGRIEVGMAATGEEAVSFWVADNGQGIDEATRARIFEPYFTTKPVDQGSGLGLAVVHGIVKAHGGQIHLESRPGLGSRFTVELPRASAEPRPAANAPPSPPPAPELEPERPGLPRTGHVLYVDDEELMRLLVGELLAQGGHRVTLCSQATQALAHLQDDGMAFDLVVTDFNMPGASGLDLAREVARARPGLPVVISSGHVSESLRTEARQAGVFHVMHKEQTLETLGEVVARALNTR